MEEFNLMDMFSVNSIIKKDLLVLEEKEKINSLKRAGDAVENISFTDIEKNLLNEISKANYITLANCESAVAKAFHNALKTITFNDKGMVENMDVIEELSKLTGVNIYIEQSSLTTHYYMGRRYADEILACFVLDETISFHGMLYKRHPNNRKNSLFKDGVHMADPSELLALIYLMKISADYIKENIPDIYYCSGKVSELAHLMNEDSVSKEGNISNEIRELLDKIMGTYLFGKEDDKSYSDVTLYISDRTYNEYPERVSEKMLDFLKKHFRVRTYKEYDKESVGCLKTSFTKIKQILDETGSLKGTFVDVPDFLWLIPMITYKLFEYSYEYMDIMRKKIEEYKYWVKPIILGKRNVVIDAALKEVLPENTKKYVYYKDFVSTNNELRAKSYETLKNHTQKMGRFMENNILLKYFAGVEADDEVDMSKLSSLTEEIEQTIEYLGINTDIIKPNYLRFRKLGNHKAAGVYFYGTSVRCLCVDIRDPWSFIHEFGHLIDYMNEGIAAKEIFSKVYSRYENIVRKNPDSKNLSGKYNLDYYMKPTEVFARCFEIYCDKYLNIKNSLIKVDYSKFYYPDDFELNIEIESFFSSFLETITEKVKVS